MSQNQQAVEALIRSAFGTHSPPCARSIYYASDVRPCDPEGLQIIDAFAGKHWTDVPLESLRLYTALPFATLTPEASRYYLPAFMLAAMEPEENEVRQRTIFSLNPFDGDGVPYPRTEVLARYEGFSKLQRIAIREFLKFCIDIEEDEVTRSMVASNLDRIRELW